MTHQTALLKSYSRRAAIGFIGGTVGAIVIAGCDGGDASTDGGTPDSSSGSTSGSSSSSSSGNSCAITDAKTQGPYWVDEKLSRSDVRTDTSGSAGTQSGVLLTMTLYVYQYASGACTPLSGVYVDIWHANALGLYSDESQPGGNTTGSNYLRGYQISDAKGAVSFTTIYPGWYSGRAPHIHVRFRVFDSSGNTSYNNTTQLFFDPTLTSTLYANNSPYNTRSSIQPDTTNSTDNIYESSLLIGLDSQGSGYDGAYVFGYPLNGSGD